MKPFSIPPPASTFTIALVLAFLASSSTAHTPTKKPLRLTHNYNASPGSSVRSRKSWFGHFCLPFLPFHCGPEQSPSSPPFWQPPPSPTPTPPPASPPPMLPPQPPSYPSQLVFADQRLAVVYPIIQNFKRTITVDPLGITKTWVGPDLCSYKGFFCDNPPDNVSAITVASIDFNGYQLTAPTLDGFLEQLPDLALFHANSNNFAGTISADIAKLRYLYELDISNNKLSGAFPVSVLGMDSLTFLDIRFNMFSGVVPPTIFTQSLEVLFLNDNDFMSAWPENLGNSHILYLTLAGNKYTGPLPNDISVVLSALTEVVLQRNQLSGCLPYEIGLLKAATVFDVSYNQLTGPLPLSLACLENIELLNLAGNQFLGILPDLICKLPNLANLSVADNYLTQVGPACGRLINRGLLDVRNNCIPGLPFQRSLPDCTAFLAVPRFCPLKDTFNHLPCIPPRFH